MTSLLEKQKSRPARGGFSQMSMRGINSALSLDDKSATARRSAARHVLMLPCDRRDSQTRLDEAVA